MTGNEKDDEIRELHDDIAELKDELDKMTAGLNALGDEIAKRAFDVYSALDNHDAGRRVPATRLRAGLDRLRVLLEADWIIDRAIGEWERDLPHFAGVTYGIDLDRMQERVSAAERAPAGRDDITG